MLVRFSNKFIFFGLFISTACHTSSSFAQAENQNNYSAFVAALSAMSVSANEPIQNQRNAARLAFVRQKVTERVLAAYPFGAATTPVGNTISLAGALDETELLCDFRTIEKVVVARISPREPKASITVDNLTSRAQQDFVNAVTGQLQALAAPSDASDIPSAIKALFASYQIDIAKKPTADANDQRSYRNSCLADLKEFDAAYYGMTIAQPANAPPGGAEAAGPAGGGGTGLPDLSFFGPVGVLFDTVAAIVQPVLTNFANILNDANKRAAIKKFLSDPVHKHDIIEAGAGLGQTASSYLFAKRLSLAGDFAEQIALIGGDPVDLKSKEVDAACKDVAASKRDNKGILSPQFRVCYSVIWDHFEKRVDAALKVAASYDQLADTGNTTMPLNKFNGMVAKYDDIVQNSAETADLWKDATKMLSFAGAVATAFSQDNLKKIEAAFNAIGKGK